MAICYQSEHVDDALTLFYFVMDRDGDGRITSHDIIQCVQLIEKDAGDFEGDLVLFCKGVFGVETVNDDKSMHFDRFSEAVKLQKETNIVQQFLQFIVFSFLGLEFDDKFLVIVR